LTLSHKTRTQTVNGTVNRHSWFTMTIALRLKAPCYIWSFIQDTSNNYADVQHGSLDGQLFSDQCGILLSLQLNTPLIFCLILQSQLECNKHRSEYLGFKTKQKDFGQADVPNNSLAVVNHFLLTWIKR